MVSGIAGSELEHAIAAVYRPFPIDDPASGYFGWSGDEYAPQFRNQLLYLSGSFDAILKTYDALPHGAGKLTASSSALPAAIALGNLTKFHEIEADLHRLTGPSADPEVRAYAEHVLAIAYLGARTPQRIAQWIKEGDFARLPAPVRYSAYAQRAQYLAITRDYEAMLNTAQMTLHLMRSVCSTEETSLTGIDLRIQSAIALLHLGRTEAARTWLQSAMDIALPHGFITLFAENIVKLGGLVEELLDQHYPQWKAPIVSMAGRVVPNWMMLDDRLLPTAPSTTSVQDLEIAYCAARGLTAAEIAKRFHLSAGTVSNKLQRLNSALGAPSSRPTKGLRELAFGPE